MNKLEKKLRKETKGLFRDEWYKSFVKEFMNEDNYIKSVVDFESNEILFLNVGWIDKSAFYNSILIIEGIKEDVFSKKRFAIDLKSYCKNKSYSIKERNTRGKRQVNIFN